MEIFKENLTHWFIIFIPALIILACAKPAHLNITYQVPALSEDLKGKTVVITVKDQRENKVVFGDAIKAEFQTQDNQFGLSLKRGTDNITQIGLFRLPALFKEAFKQRLQNEGVIIKTPSKGNEAVFEIVLKIFQIRRKGFNWTTKVSYEVNLIKDNQLIAREKISGTSERFKLLGKNTSEKVISNIFTETLNQLDIKKLFQQAMF